MLNCTSQPLCIYYFLSDETDVYLTDGSGGPLQVDDDSARLQRGVLQISRISGGEVNFA